MVHSKDYMVSGKVDQCLPLMENQVNEINHIKFLSEFNLTP